MWVKNMNENVIIHIPHSSMEIPKEFIGSFCVDQNIINKNLVAMTDYAVDRLFDHPRFTNRLISPVSRLVCDVERFRDDDREEMSKAGMGAVYTRGAYGEPLRVPDALFRDKVLNTYYDPHHKNLLEKTNETISCCGRCVIVDAHSFASSPLPYEPDQAPDRPDFCIRTDEHHTPAGLSDCLMRVIEDRGYTAMINRPYRGTIVPLPLYGSQSPVFSIMIEINRRLYMNEASQELLPHFQQIYGIVGLLLDAIESWEYAIH
jgi:N-formylglutamate amidohydrolase